MKTMRFQAALRALSGPELADLAGCLARDCDENGITGELLGMCLQEALERARNPESRTQNQEG